MTVRIVDGIAVDIAKKDVKRITLRVSPDCRVSLSAPKRMKDQDIDRYVESKKEWIEEALVRFRNANNGADRSFLDGSTASVLGKALTVHSSFGPRFGCNVDGDALLITFPEGTEDSEREPLMREWYRRILKETAAPIFDELSSETGLIPDSWHTKYMRSRWGTCNHTAKRIWLNVRLAEKPAECIEYVILHELVHLKVPDHGPEFKRLMGLYMPDWKERKKLLNFGRSQ